MFIACNACRLFHGRCRNHCYIRPCLAWIKTPQSQSNVISFLCGVYGRTGLKNLIKSGPEHLHPVLFKSLLFEACGRIINPIYGSVGLLWSGNWHLYKIAVEDGLKGRPIVQIPLEYVAQFKKKPKEDNSDSAPDLHKPRNHDATEHFLNQSIKLSKVLESEQADVDDLWLELLYLSFAK